MKAVFYNMSNSCAADAGRVDRGCGFVAAGVGMLVGDANDDGSLLRFAGQMEYWRTRAGLVIADTPETVLRERRYRRPFESSRQQVHAGR
jgi:hypothetical protein